MSLPAQEIVVESRNPTLSVVSPSAVDRRWLRRYAKFVVAAVVFLIFMGALVKSHEAGLAVPDWPTSYGDNMFLFPPSQWVGGVWYEHVHRLVASGIGMLTLILALWLGFAEKRRSVRWLGYGALGLVIVQGILGGVTVLYGLPAAVSVSHGVIAQTFLCLTILIAYTQSREFTRPRETPLRSTLFLLGGGTTLLVYIQLIIGAIMRHSESGLAIPDFPLMGGMALPTFSDQMLDTVNQMRSELMLPAATIPQVVVHFAHRVGAIVVTAAVLITAGFALRKGMSSVIKRSAAYLILAVLFQALLGVATVLSVKEPLTTSFHVVIGAVLLGLSFLLTLRAFPRS